MQLDDIFSDINSDVPQGGEISLWRAVIIRAFEDLSMTPHRTSEKVDKNQAIKWFSERGGDFYDVCSNAHVDPELVRLKALEIIELNLSK